MTPMFFGQERQAEKGSGTRRDDFSDELHPSSFYSKPENSKSSTVFPSSVGDEQSSLMDLDITLPNALQAAEMSSQHEDHDFIYAILSVLHKHAGSQFFVKNVLSAAVLLEICSLVAPPGEDGEINPSTLPLVLRALRPWRTAEERSFEDLARRFANLGLEEETHLLPQHEKAPMNDPNGCVLLPPSPNGPVLQPSLPRSITSPAAPSSPAAVESPKLKKKDNTSAPAHTSKVSRLPLFSNAISGNRSSKVPVLSSRRKTAQVSSLASGAPSTKRSSCPRGSARSLLSSALTCPAQGKPIQSSILFPTTLEISRSIVPPGKNKDSRNPPPSQRSSPTLSATNRHTSTSSSRKPSSARLDQPLSPPSRACPQSASSTRFNIPAAQFKPPMHTSKRALTMLDSGRVVFPPWSPYRYSPPTEANNSPSPLRSRPERNSSM